ncbi:hypothetical protein [Massilia timonae]|uniref:Uncharacterized protein n=1 Tax=Massilia timonae TaxID=47229 RepID=A0A1S2NEG1_9BURK|nr:hypothetical protein [Massilia timonae]OIJ43457.1 hypothetical protein LO55_5067 [Massilia timonae]
MKRRLGQALAFVMAFLIIVGEVQRSEAAADERAARAMYGAGK